IWQAKRQPVVLSEWNPTDETRDVFSTVMNWTSYKPLEYNGRSFGQKDVEFCRFVDLPESVAPTKLEIAISRTQHMEWQTQWKNLPPRAMSFVRENPTASP